MQRNPAVTVSGMLPVYRFNLRFEGKVFGEQPSLTIEVFAVDAQRLSTDPLVLGTTDELYFFCKCMFKVSSPMSRLSSSFSRFSLLYCSTETTASPLS